MFKKLIFIGIIVSLFSSCEFVLKNKDEVLALQKKDITYDDFTYETDSFNHIVYLDNDRKRMNGHFKVTYNDKIAEEFEVKSGLLNGFLKNYFPEGMISKEKNYSNGVLEGISESYFKDGSISEKGTYKNGKIVGELVSYNKDGDVVSIRKTVEGVKYHHMFDKGKMKISEFKKNIDGTVYDLIVKYDAFENISIVLGKRDYVDNPNVIYIFNAQFELIETINKNEEPSKVAYYLNFLRPRN